MPKPDHKESDEKASPTTKPNNTTPRKDPCGFSQ